MLHQFQRGFQFPYFTFTHPILHRLGLSLIAFQYYSHLYNDWVGIDVNHSLRLSDITHPVLFVKAAMVDRCLTFAESLKQFPTPCNTSGNHDAHSPRRSLSQRPLSTDPYDSNHLFHGTVLFGKKSNAALTQRVKGKQRAQTQTVSSNDSLASDTEPSAVVVPSKRPHHRCHSRSSHDDSSSSASHSNSSTGHPDSKFTAVIIPHKRHHCLSLSESDSELGQGSSSESTDSVVDEASTGNLLTHGHSKENAIEVENVRHWPVDFYVSEIAEGFEQCSKAAATHRGVGKVFQRFFGVKFTSSTFYDNRRVWEHPPNLALRRRLIAQGRHKDATWVAFMAKAERPPRA